MVVRCIIKQTCMSEKEDNRSAFFVKFRCRKASTSSIEYIPIQCRLTYFSNQSTTNIALRNFKR